MRTDVASELGMQGDYTSCSDCHRMVDGYLVKSLPHASVLILIKQTARPCTPGDSKVCPPILSPDTQGRAISFGNPSGV